MNILEIEQLKVSYLLLILILYVNDQPKVLFLFGNTNFQLKNSTNLNKIFNDFDFFISEKYKEMPTVLECTI